AGVLLFALRPQATGAATFDDVMQEQHQPGAQGGQGQGGQPQQLAEERFKNIQIFKGQPAQNVMRAMQFFTRSLGVECSFCHVPHQMDKDDKEEKKFARTMYQIVQFANKSIGKPRVSCYTCHAGHQEPEVPAEFSHAAIDEMFKKAAAENSKPAETVFKNIQVFKGQPAGIVMPAMRLIAKELGVKCDFCHVVGQFDKDDKPQKNTARQMVGMMYGIAKEFTHGEVMIGCYTCHKGQPQPVSMPPQATSAQPGEKKAEEKKPEEKKPNQ
ncbi:MAG TPA: photosynthetic reaction center cytochrome c subunit family protein, partial [Blastocatellia bacterium]|nr:photosynthetic reaction center cytochrome c subunit family protein [Blastocatellia bacterium]